MAAAMRIRHLFWFTAALLAVDAILFSAASLAATTSISLQVTAVVQNTCRFAVTLPVSAPPANLRNTVKIDCDYGQPYTIAESAAVDAESAPAKSVAPVSGNAMIVTVTY